jgi:branched-subunit amino acid ABC-type transport system permease component
MGSFHTFFLRALVGAAGLLLALLFALLFASVFLLLLGVWSARALWARLTGRPATPFGVHMASSRAFAQMVRRARAGPASRTARAPASAVPGRVADVTDVEPRFPR